MRRSRARRGKKERKEEKKKQRWVSLSTARGALSRSVSSFPSFSPSASPSFSPSASPSFSPSASPAQALSPPSPFRPQRACFHCSPRATVALAVVELSFPLSSGVAPPRPLPRRCARSSRCTERQPPDVPLQGNDAPRRLSFSRSSFLSLSLSLFLSLALFLPLLPPPVAPSLVYPPPSRTAASAHVRRRLTLLPSPSALSHRKKRGPSSDNVPRALGKSPPAHRPFLAALSSLPFPRCPALRAPSPLPPRFRPSLRHGRAQGALQVLPAGL